MLDASAPAVLLDWQEAVAGGQLGPSVKTMAGETSVRTAAVQVELTAATGADKSRVKLTCQDDSTGAWYTLVDMPSGALAVGSTRRWEGEIHQGSACRLVLTPAGGVSGNVKACGKTVKEWTGEAADSKTLDFTAYSDALRHPRLPGPALGRWCARGGSGLPVGPAGIGLRERGSAGGGDPPPAFRRHDW